MPETNDSTPPVSEATTAREKFEQERLSRRAALRKIGMTTGMALFGMFAVDDLARISLSALKQHKETQAIAQTVAEELRSSGVAFADAASEKPSLDFLANATDTGTGIGQTCTQNARCEVCVAAACKNLYPVFTLRYGPGKRYNLCVTAGDAACGTGVAGS